MLSFGTKRLTALVPFFVIPLGAAQAGGNRVGMEGWEFDPAELTIRKGESVTWVNDDDTAHNLAFETELESAPTLEKPTKVRMTEEFTLAFNKAGVYKYTCKIHRNYDMNGVITVTDSAE